MDSTKAKEFGVIDKVSVPQCYALVVLSCIDFTELMRCSWGLDSLARSRKDYGRCSLT